MILLIGVRVDHSPSLECQGDRGMKSYIHVQMRDQLFTKIIGLRTFLIQLLSLNIFYSGRKYTEKDWVHGLKCNITVSKFNYLDPMG